MEDFNQYASSQKSTPNGNLMDLVTSLANKFDGKNQNELLMEIYKQAKQGKQNGTLTNEQLDGFAQMLAPFLDDKKRSMLNKIVAELKKI